MSQVRGRGDSLLFRPYHVGPSPNVSSKNGGSKRTRPRTVVSSDYLIRSQVKWVGGAWGLSIGVRITRSPGANS